MSNSTKSKESANTKKSADSAEIQAIVKKLTEIYSATNKKRVFTIILMIICIILASISLIYGGNLYSKNKNTYSKQHHILKITADRKEQELEDAKNSYKKEKNELTNKQEKCKKNNSTAEAKNKCDDYEKKISELATLNEPSINKLNLLYKQAKKDLLDLNKLIKIEPIIYLFIGVIFIIVTTLIFFYHRLLYLESQKILCRIDRYHRFGLASYYCDKLESKEVNTQADFTDVLEVMASIELVNQLEKAFIKKQSKIERLKSKLNKNSFNNEEKEKKIDDLKEELKTQDSILEIQKKDALNKLLKLKAPKKESVEVRSGLIKAIYKFEKEEC